MSSGSTTSVMSTSAVIDTVDSLTPREIAMWEWVSMAPGATCSPSPSITATPSGTANAAPISAMRPSRTNRSPMKAGDSAVCSVAPSMKKLPA
jgi:hypothetical protein